MASPSSSTLLSRRALLACAAGSPVLLPAFAAAEEALAPYGGAGEIGFDVRRGRSSIGSHVLQFAREGDLLRVAIAIELRVRLGFVTLFRYSHRNDETWRGDRLVAMDTRTDDNGDLFEVTARAEGDQLIADGVDGRIALPGDVLPTSYWRAETPERAILLDTQRGRVREVSSALVGSDRVAWRGGEVGARRYAMRGDLNLDLWYTDENEWARIAFEARGATIAYRPRDGVGVGSAPT
ncbi:MAG: DUF6134 family protein [Caulobacterales bacterium]|nr:DUF6134 family protein [Caulobacterales bacterium]